MNNFDYKNMTPFKWFVLENFPFIENDFEAINNYRLFSKVVEYLNKTIDNVNVLGNLVEQFSDYFDNLDVQEEINNKLDEMVEAGTLQEIIADYLNSKAVFGFDTVNDMKQATNLINGSYAKTLGFYSKNDGGMATYKIRNITNDDIVDNMFIIALNDENLIAELIYNTNIDILSLGAKNDGITDNKNIIDKAIEKLVNGGTLYFPDGNYLTSGGHIIDNLGKITIKGSGEYSTKIIYNGNNICFYAKNENNSHLFVPVEFRDFTINGTDTESETIAFRLSDKWGYIIKNILCFGFNNGTFCQFYNDYGWTEGAIITNCMIREAKNGFSCKRNIDRSEYDSFFNIKIDNVYMSIRTGCNFINLKETENENFPIIAYSWIVNSTVWASGDPLYIKVGAYNLLSGKFTLVQDGGIAPIQVYDDGMCDIEGTLIYRQNISVQNMSRKIFTSLKQNTRWKTTTDRRPLARFKGLRIFGGTTIESSNTNSIIYNSDYLPPYTNYKLTLKGRLLGSDVEFNYQYLITLLDANHNPLIKVINQNMNYDDGYIYPRPLNNGTPGEIQSNAGLQFDLYIKELNNNVIFNFELEML